MKGLRNPVWIWLSGSSFDGREQLQMYTKFCARDCNLTLRFIFFDGISARYEAMLIDETDIDDGPSTFTMEDHLNFLVSVGISCPSTYPSQSVRTLSGSLHYIKACSSLPQKLSSHVYRSTYFYYIEALFIRLSFLQTPFYELMVVQGN